MNSILILSLELKILVLMITFQLVDMLRKYSLYILLINFIYQYYVFFHWYLSDQQIQIENAFSMGLIAFLAGIIFILFVHIIYFPKSLNDSAQIPTYPPLIMLLSLNLGFLVGVSNLYLFQLYSLPNFLDIFRSSNLGFFIIIISFVIILIVAATVVITCIATCELILIAFLSQAVVGALLRSLLASVRSLIAAFHLQYAAFQATRVPSA